MLNVVAVCSGNTCRSPLFAAALHLLSDDVSVRSACAPNWKKEDDSRPVPGMSGAFENAANQLIRFGIVDQTRRRVLPGLVRDLSNHRKTEFNKLDPQPSGHEVFVAAARKHVPNLRKWAKSVECPKARVEVVGISDFAWKVWTLQETRRKKNKRKRNKGELTELKDAYHALAILTILRACEIFPEIHRRSQGGDIGSRPTGSE
jgi:hypothetical protein